MVVIDRIFLEYLNFLDDRRILVIIGFVGNFVMFVFIGLISLLWLFNVLRV